MMVSSVLTSGQWGYPIQGLGSYGRATEKKHSCMLFTFEQVNAGSGALDSNYSLSLYPELDHDQDGMEIEAPKTFSFIFLSKEDRKYSETELA